MPPIPYAGRDDEELYDGAALTELEMMVFKYSVYMSLSGTVSIMRQLHEVQYSETGLTTQILV